MPGNCKPGREGKVSVAVICVLIGVISFVLGGLCGGGLTAMLAVVPARRAMEQTMEAEQQMADVARARQAEAEAAVRVSREAVGSLTGAVEKAVPSRKAESEQFARALFENIRADRAQAAWKRFTAEYRTKMSLEPFQKLLATYPLPPRTEAIGDEMQPLPPIDEQTHQYRYSTKSIDGRPVVFTLTVVYAAHRPFEGEILTVYGVEFWAADQLTVAEGIAEKQQ